MLKGDLQVTVQDDAEGNAIAGATVTATSPSQTVTGTTDVNGQVLFSSLAPDVYTVTATKTNCSTATNNNVTVVPGAGSSGTPQATVLLALSIITVTLNIPVTVACPGYPLEMNASATPGGGTMTWTTSGGQLVDSTGSTPLTTGNQVYLVSYQPDNQNGNIPSQNITVTVNYALNGGTGTANKAITVHAVNFNVTGLNVTSIPVAAAETATFLTLGGPTATANIMETKPTVQIQLDSSCTRQSACAANYRLGWLQTMRSNTRTMRWSQTAGQTTADMPIRDAITQGNGASTLVPFYSVTQSFAANNDQQTALHFDSPKMQIQWTDPTTSNPPPDKRLRNATLSNEFTAWLVAENEEWDNNHQNNGFVFLRNFDWSVNLAVTVDVSKPVGSRCTPQNSNPSIGSVGTGQGSRTPVFTGPVFNTSSTSSSNAAPEIP